MSHEFPFEGIKVLDASQGIAGPSAGMMLAQYGADVIKVEPREGDWSRSIGSGKERMTSLSVTTNLGKRSIALDLKHPEGSAIFRRLAQGTDVFIENFRTGVMQRLGFGYADVAAYNPAVIYLSVTGFGQDGPLRERPATDAILQAFTGIMGVNKGVLDGLPHRIECWPIDVATGQYAFQAVAVALYARRDTGRGRHIDASLLQGAVALQSVRVMEHVLSGGAQTVSSAFPVGSFRTADGWMNLSVLKDALWPSFCRIVGRPDWAADPSLAAVAGRRERSDEITAFVVQTFSTQPSAHWCAQFTEAGILNERVNSYDEMLAHPQTAAVGLFTWVEQEEIGRVPHPNLPGVQPLESDSARAKVPTIGAHSREVLAELGYAGVEIDRLIASGVVFTRVT